jgi:DNA-binding NtrC family response regulator
MELRGKVVLVCVNDGVFGELDRVLKALGLEPVRVHRCKELQSCLEDLGRFLAVFTEPALADGRYSDVCWIASRLEAPLPVIVVSTFADMDLYLESMKNGASDFIVPPFFITDIAYVLMTTLGSALPQRAALSQHAVGATRA